MAEVEQRSEQIIDKPKDKHNTGLTYNQAAGGVPPVTQQSANLRQPVPGTDPRQNPSAQAPRPVPSGQQPQFAQQPAPAPQFPTGQQFTGGQQSQAQPQLVQQQRPVFQAGGPVNQFATRPAQPGNQPPNRGPAPQEFKVQGTPRPSGPQSFAPQQAPLRPQQPQLGPQQSRPPPPNSLQFGSRQPAPLGTPGTPDQAKPQPFIPQPQARPQGPVTNARPADFRTGSPGNLSRQSSQASIQGLENNVNNIKSTLENIKSYDKINNGPENGSEAAAMAKTRSYSIAAAPGAPSPLKMEADRRQSVSAIGGKADEVTSRAPALGLIQENDNPQKAREPFRGSKESVRSDMSNDQIDRPDSRLSSSKMSESFIGSFNTTPKRKDDNDDVVLQNARAYNKEVPKFHTQERPPITKENLSDLKQPPISVPASYITQKPQEVQRPLEPQRFIPQAQAKPAEQPVSRTVKKSSHEVKKPQEATKVANSPIPTVANPQQSAPKKPTELASTDARVTSRRAISAKARPKDGDNDSGVEEGHGNEMNGSPGSPGKKSPGKTPTRQQTNGMKPLSRSSSKSATAKTPENPPTQEKKKVPMNKIQVGNAPSPNIKAVKSKIGSLQNTSYKPGGGHVKIESKKLDFQNVTPRIAAKNDTYMPGGGDKKITQTKLQWNAKSKIGSLENTTHKPKGGDKKIETVKLDFKEKAKPKVASTVNITHKPGGGAVKIENQKLDIKAQSKIGSLDNVKHKPKGGEVKIFDDKHYLKQMSAGSSHCQSGQESPIPPEAHAPKSDANMNQQH